MTKSDQPSDLDATMPAMTGDADLRTQPILRVSRVTSPGDDADLPAISLKQHGPHPALGDASPHGDASQADAAAAEIERALSNTAQLRVQRRIEEKASELSAAPAQAPAPATPASQGATVGGHTARLSDAVKPVMKTGEVAIAWPGRPAETPEAAEWRAKPPPPAPGPAPARLPLPSRHHSDART